MGTTTSNQNNNYGEYANDVNNLSSIFKIGAKIFQKGKILGPISNLLIIPGIAFEIAEDGLWKGLFSGGVSAIAGDIGFALGGIAGGVVGCFGGAIAGTIAGAGIGFADAGFVGAVIGGFGGLGIGAFTGAIGGAAVGAFEGSYYLSEYADKAADRFYDNRKTDITKNWQQSDWNTYNTFSNTPLGFAANIKKETPYDNIYGPDYQTFLENQEYMKQFDYLSDPAYGLPYEHFNTYQNDPFDNDFLNSLTDPYGILSNTNSKSNDTVYIGGAPYNLDPSSFGIITPMGGIGPWASIASKGATIGEAIAGIPNAIGSAIAAVGKSMGSAIAALPGAMGSAIATAGSAIALAGTAIGSAVVAAGSAIWGAILGLLAFL